VYSAVLTYSPGHTSRLDCCKLGILEVDEHSCAVQQLSTANAICCAGADAGAVAEAARALGSPAPLLHLVAGGLQALALQARDMMTNSLSPLLQ
jgi:hypothetical protein